MVTKKETSRNDSKPQKSTKAETKNVQLALNNSNQGFHDDKPNKNLAIDKKGQQKTKITIKFDAGFSNELFIRGKGGDLKWEKGLKLVNVKHDEWIWETNAKFAQCEFKILLNDKVYENGENHQLNEGASVQYTPSFH